MSGEQLLETDYLVVGAGAMAMSFVDQLIEDPDVDVVMVDRRHAPGGHWLDAYPFVRLHQPSVLYGVHSSPMGDNRKVLDGTEAGYYERAGSAEICGYYDQVMQHRLLASGRVRFHAMSEYLGDCRFRSLLSGTETEVTVRRRVVDATYMASQVPVTQPPPFETAEGAQVVPVGALAHIKKPPAGFVVVGGGKTAYDACGWLLDQGTNPDDITWIRPRDAWMLNREFTQPLDLVENVLRSIVIQSEALAKGGSVEEVFADLEQHGIMLRTDPSVEPGIMRGATMSVGERDQLRRIENVARMGHVKRIEADQIVLDEGTIATTPDHLHIHCAAAGISDAPPRPIFEEDLITLQVVTRSSLCLSAGLLGYLETTDRSTEEKNALAPPNSWPHTPFDWLRFLFTGIRTTFGWGDAPDLEAWVENTQLSMTSNLADSSDPAVPELKRRLSKSIFPGLEHLDALTLVASESERNRIYDPTAPAA